MTTDYNQIADEYRKSKFAPWRLHIERHTLFSLLGDLRGKRVLDLACGEGFYSRQLKQAGAAEVLGIDISSEMIARAEAQEAALGLGNRYLVADAGKIDLDTKYDIVLAAYFINYASTRAMIREMAGAMARHLRPGGRLVMVNSNVENPPETWPTFRKYGFIKKGTGRRVEGEPVTWEFFLDDGTVFSLDNYHLDLDVQEQELCAAGFGAVEWIAPRLSERAAQEHPHGFFDGFLQAPPILFAQCIRE